MVGLAPFPGALVLLLELHELVLVVAILLPIRARAVVIRLFVASSSAPHFLAVNVPDPKRFVGGRSANPTRVWAVATPVRLSISFWPGSATIEANLLLGLCRRSSAATPAAAASAATAAPTTPAPTALPCA